MKVLMLLSKEVLTDDRVCREAKALTDAGYEVTVIMWDRFGKIRLKEDVDGINIVRIQNNGLMKILPNDLFRNPFWWRAAYRKALELYKRGYKFDIVHCHDLDTLQAGVWLKRKLRTRLIYDAHEVFGFMIKGSVPEIVTKYAFNMEKRLTRFVDHIITVNEYLKEYFNSMSNKPITVVMNCKDPVSLEYIPPKNDVFTLLYVGSLHRNRFLPELIDLVGRINNVKLLIAGKPEDRKLYEMVREKSNMYSNVEFLGTVPFNEVLPLTFKSDVVVALLKPIESFVIKNATMMNKQFEAMACGRPIICTKGTAPGWLTEKLRCGLAVEYNEESVRKAIITLRDNPKLCEELGRNALKAALERYNWENEKRKLLKVYESLV